MDELNISKQNARKLIDHEIQDKIQYKTKRREAAIRRKQQKIDLKIKIQQIKDDECSILINVLKDLILNPKKVNGRIGNPRYPALPLYYNCEAFANFVKHNNKVNKMVKIRVDALLYNKVNWIQTCIKTKDNIITYILSYDNTKGMDISYSTAYLNYTRYIDDGSFSRG